MSARLLGRAKGTRGSVSVTVNRHEELSDRSAPYADFGHGSLFEAAPGARRFVATAESPTKFLFKPFNIHMQHGGLHVYIDWREAIPSGAASGLNKSSGSGQRPSWRDVGVRYGVASVAMLLCAAGFWAVVVRTSMVRISQPVINIDRPRSAEQATFQGVKKVGVLRYNFLILGLSTRSVSTIMMV